MKTLTLSQGSKEWAAHRATSLNASDAAAMLGMSKYQSRTELLTQKATGLFVEPTTEQQRLFDKGHAAEAMARPIAEEIIGEELFPCVATDDNGYLSASFDGLDMSEAVAWEHKLYSKRLATQIKAQDIEPHYWAQLEHQMLVSDADKALFMTSDGTEENCEWMWYESMPERRQMILDGWAQFEKDLEGFEPQEKQITPVGRSPDNLPSLRIEVTGMVTSSNLDAFRDHALSVFQGINTDLQTDGDFASAEKTAKWCKEVESKLDAAKQQALSQTASIDDLFSAIDSIKEEARIKRLELEKLVKARKEEIRYSILQKAKAALDEHINQINKTFAGKVSMPAVTADFAGAMKGKRTIDSLRDAADTELARAKIEANQIADKIRLNLKSLNELAADYKFLFSDAQSLALKDNDDLVELIKSRITNHKQELAEQAAREEKAASQPLEKPTEVPATKKPLREVAQEKSRPTDDEIIDSLALTYRVHESKIVEWLLDMDLSAASDKLAANM